MISDDPSNPTFKSLKLLESRFGVFFELSTFRRDAQEMLKLRTMTAEAGLPGTSLGTSI